MSEGRRVTKRVPVTLATRKMLKLIANAFDTDYDTAINFLVYKLMQDQDPMIAARLMAKDFDEWRKTWAAPEDEEGDTEE